MMDVLIILFIAFDHWRILLPVGLSTILVVVPWFARGDVHSPYCLVDRSIGLITAQLAMGLFLFTGLFGLVLPWFSPFASGASFVQSGMLGMLESLFYLGGTYCLWRVKGSLVQGKGSPKQWTRAGCFLFLLVAILWIVKWDDLVFGGGGKLHEFGGTVSTWNWTSILPKMIHLLLSALAAGGLVVMLMAYLPWFSGLKGKRLAQFNRQDEEPGRIRVVRFGMAWVLGGVVPQVVVGSWLLVALGEGVRGHFLNGLTLGSVVFFVSLLVALLGLVLINAAFIAPYVKGLVWGGWVNILVALFLMGYVRYESFGAAFETFHPELYWGLLSFWHLIFGVFPLLGMLALLIKGLRNALILSYGKPTE